MRYCLLCILAFLLCLPSTAQKMDKRGEPRPYATNSAFFDNTYIGIGAGVNLFAGDCDISHEYDSFGSGNLLNYCTNNITPSIDVFFGKWWTPVVGIRLAYHGYELGGYTTNTNGPFVSQDWDLPCGHVRERMNYNSGRIDVTLNLCNAIQGYRSDRFWDVIPYIGFGAANVNGKNVRTGIRTDVWRFIGDAGFLNNLRLCKRWAITLDFRYTMSDNLFDLAEEQSGHKVDGIFTASAGISVKLGEAGFHHSETPDYSSYENELARYKQQLDDINKLLAERMKQIDGLKGEIAACDKSIADLRSKSKTKDATLVVYFGINSAELDSKELSILDAFLKNNNGKCEVSVQATADNRYGSESYNRKLSGKRAEYISNLLRDKYGVTTSSNEGIGEVDTHTNPVLNRAGIIHVSFE